MDNAKERKEINLLEVALVFLRKWWFILIVSVVCSGIVLCCAKFLITPKYSASIKMYVNNSSYSKDAKDTISSSDISASKTLVDTYEVVLNTRNTLNEVIKYSGLDYTYEELSDMISSEAVNNTEVLMISVTNENAKDAYELANAIAAVLPQKITDIVEGSSVSVVDNAVVPTKISSPSYTNFALYGFLIGFVISCAIVIVTYYLNDTVESDQWIKDTFGEKVPLLAVIPDVNVSHANKKYGYYYSSRSGNNEK